MKTPKLAEGWRMMCLNCYLGEEFNYVEGKIKRRNTSSTVSSRKIIELLWQTQLQRRTIPPISFGLHTRLVSYVFQQRDKTSLKTKGSKGKFLILF